MSNSVKFNIRNVHYAPITAIDESTGEITYGDVAALKGAKSITLEPQEGEDNIVYADGEEYYVETGAGSKSGSLVVAELPDDFLTAILGETEDTNGALWESDNDDMTEFALGFTIDGSVRSTYFWYQRVSVTSKPKLEAATNEANKTFAQDELPIKCKPGANGYVRVKSGASTATTNWFDEVISVPAT
jgi:phi13 family phage major tail protein